MSYFSSLDINASSSLILDMLRPSRTHQCNPKFPKNSNKIEWIRKYTKIPMHCHQTESRLVKRVILCQVSTWQYKLHKNFFIRTFICRNTKCFSIHISFFIHHKKLLYQNLYIQRYKMLLFTQKLFSSS